MIICDHDRYLALGFVWCVGTTHTCSLTWRVIFCFWGKQWYPLSNRCVLDLCKQNLGIQQSFYQDARPRHVMGLRMTIARRFNPWFGPKEITIRNWKGLCTFFCQYLSVPQRMFSNLLFWFCTTVVTSLDGLWLLLTFVCTAYIHYSNL